MMTGTHPRNLTIKAFMFIIGASGLHYDTVMPLTACSFAMKHFEKILMAVMLLTFRYEQSFEEVVDFENADVNSPKIIAK